MDNNNSGVLIVKHPGLLLFLILLLLALMGVMIYFAFNGYRFAPGARLV